MPPQRGDRTVRLIDINHALAHLRSARQIIVDSGQEFTAQELATVGDALHDIEKVLKDKERATA
jgi:hypothetical protein